MKWRNLNYKSSDGVKFKTEIPATDNYENDVIEAKGRSFKSLSKALYDTFGEVIK